MCWTSRPANGGYWSPESLSASEGSVELGFEREPFWSSIWAGDGFFVWKTSVSGAGKVALDAPGPIRQLRFRTASSGCRGGWCSAGPTA